MIEQTILDPEDARNRREYWLQYLRDRRRKCITRYRLTRYGSIKHDARQSALRYSAMLRGMVQ